jgi:hypothetical protein
MCSISFLLILHTLFMAFYRNERYTGLLFELWNGWKESTRVASTLLLPDPAVLALVSVEVNEEAKMITATAKTTSREAHCPVCRHSADRIHSKYVRTLADLPCSGQRVR